AEGRLFACISDKFVVDSVDVVDKPGAHVVDTLLVGDVSAPGSVELDGVSYQYTNSTHVVATGTPGKTVEVSLLDYLEPPMLPLLKYSMQRAPVGGQINDEMIGVSADAEQITVSSSFFRNLSRAYEYSENSKLSIEYDVLEAVNNLGVVFNLKRRETDAAGELFSYEDLGLSLTVDVGGQLTWKRV